MLYFLLESGAVGLWPYNRMVGNGHDDSSVGSEGRGRGKSRR